MKIGIFDSGLGGLLVAKAIHELMPKYDYVYLGDTKRVPYGNRSHEKVFQFTREGVDYLFRKENCAIVVIACNTASARALRRIQKEYLIKNFSDRTVLGVLIPAAEIASNYKRVGILATTGTVASKTFPIEINKLDKKIKVFQNSAPMLVSLIEKGDNSSSDEFILEYLKPLLHKKIDALVLGCTHYPILKSKFKKYAGKNVKIISQDEIVPKKLKSYLEKHKEVKNKLSKGGTVKILVSEKTQTVDTLALKWFGNIKPRLVHL